MSGLSYFTIRKSIFGRILGISSTGGLVMGVKATNTTLAGSSDVSMAAQMWGPGMVETISASSATISNYGITIISSDSTAGAAYYIKAPVQGVDKQIHVFTSATAVSINTTATSIKFNTTLAALGIGGGSTILNVTGPATGTFGAIRLVGLSTTVWSVASHSVGSSS